MSLFYLFNTYVENVSIHLITAGPNTLTELNGFKVNRSINWNEVQIDNEVTDIRWFNKLVKTKQWHLMIESIKCHCFIYSILMLKMFQST
jgi:hypothetical protein